MELFPNIFYPPSFESMLVESAGAEPVGSEACVLISLSPFFFFSSNQTRIWPILYFSIYNLHDTKFAFLNQIQARCLCVFPGQCTRH